MSDERVRTGLAHLQAAALELIAAARTFLDVAEDRVGDLARPAPPVPPGPPAGETPPAPGFQHIDVR